MSSQRHLVNNLLRNGQRLVSVPHTAHTACQHDDEQQVQTPGRLSEAVLPLIKLTAQPSNIQFEPNLSIGAASATHWVPSVFLDIRSALNLLSFRSQDGVVPLKSSKRLTCEASVQTDEIEHVTRDKRIEKLKWELEVQIAEEQLEDGQYAEAIRRLQAAAGHGNVDAMYDLADCLFNGFAVIADKKQAVALWEQAAVLGHPESQYAFALSLLQGDGIEKNISQAMRFMNMAAHAGNSDAAFYMVVRRMRDGVIDGTDKLMKIAAHSKEYEEEMRSWLTDECLDDSSLSLLNTIVGPLAPPQGIQLLPYS